MLTEEANDVFFFYCFFAVKCKNIKSKRIFFFLKRKIIKDECDDYMNTMMESTETL